jgi:hypothetical protein
MGVELFDAESLDVMVMGLSSATSFSRITSHHTRPKVAENTTKSSPQTRSVYFIIVLS